MKSKGLEMLMNSSALSPVRVARATAHTPAHKWTFTNYAYSFRKGYEALGGSIG